ncbi:hypothetical protein ACFL4C_02310 [Candidatus Omnitrophota bacterium]
MLLRLGGRLGCAALAFLLLTTQGALSYEAEDSNNAQGQLIQIYKEWLDLETRVFNSLSFRLSSLQLIREGFCAKLTLEDNLGRKWIFKPDYTEASKPHYGHYYVSGESACVIYRAYKLFGLQTPRIHFITLDINQKRVSGSIQEFMPNQGTLSKHPPYQISYRALSYLVKNHVIDWLLANYDCSPQNFLVLSFDETGQAEKIMRVDNEIAYWSLDNSELRYDWPYPQHQKPRTKYYYQLWKNYILKKISLGVENNFAFVQFVSDVPDDFFAKLILPVRTHSFKEISQSEFDKIKEEYGGFLKPMLCRKRSLIKDFKAFYIDLAKKREASLRFSKQKNYQKIVAAVSDNLIQEIEKLKKEKLQLIQAPSHASNIEAIFSLEGFFWLKQVYGYLYRKEDMSNLASVCNEALEKLVSLKAVTENKHEKEALEVYIGEVKKIRSGKSPSYNFAEINKIIDSVVPKN